ncbi:hypothetical protein B0H14DRAFT_3133908 [Mycena olivaceomarginata]|nr:hypothetical protein B0H14DRAFT_3133908 [Mycena olivaceomarginata]
MSHHTTNVYCIQCDLTFVDVVACSEHIETSTNHPCCKTCCRRFLNQNSLFLHLKYAAPHLSPAPQDDEEEVVDGDEVLLSWRSGFMPDVDVEEEYRSEEECWSEDFDTSSIGSASDSGTELDSEHEIEYNRDHMILLAGTEPGPEYREWLFENLDDLSGIPAMCHCLLIADSGVITMPSDKRRGPPK